MQTQPITDQIANISPLYVVLIVTVFTLIRVALARTDQPWARAVSETCDTINFVLILAFLLVRPFVAQAFYIPSASMRPTLIEGDRLIVDKFSYRLHEPRRGDIIVFNAPPEATDEHVDGIDYIKRLVGLPGDVVQVQAASLRIADEPYDPVSYGQTVHSFVRTRLNIGEEESLKFFPDHVLVGGSRQISKAELATALGVTPSELEIIPGKTMINGEVLNESYTREDPDYSYPALRLGEGKYFVFGDNRNQSRDSHIWNSLSRDRVVGRALFTFWPLSRIGRIE